MLEAKSVAIARTANFRNGLIIDRKGVDGEGYEITPAHTNLLNRGKAVMEGDVSRRLRAWELYQLNTVQDQ